MTTRSRAEHDAAVSRRLQLLGEELASVRGPGHVGHPVPAPEGVVEVPVPGRHAARRGGAPPLVPEALRGRVGIGAGPLVVVAVLVALGLGATTWWVVRSEPTPLAPVSPQPAPGLASSVAEATPSASATVGGTVAGTAEVTVDVAGKVRRPGIVVLDAGSRVVDALEAAGGARPGVDLSGLNLARLLVDGEQVVVGVPPPATGLPSGGSAGVAPVGALVDLNTADQVALESLPEVGPVTAVAIITWREQNGGFTAIAELLEVDGIGDATLAAMEPFVTV